MGQLEKFIFMKKLKAFINNLLGLLFIRGFFTAISTTFILQREYGHFLSATLWSAVDKKGDPIPWFSYPAIEYLSQFDLSDKTVFEYGSGNSTIFWGKRTKKVISVEDDKNWFNKIKNQYFGKNVIFLYCPEKQAYVNSINNYKLSFDIIVIDGSHRAECARIVIRKLKKGGMVIFDNADWDPKTAKFLREQRLIEVDMAGFSPINHRVSTTSLFLRRDFNFKPISRQPLGGPGSVDTYKSKTVKSKKK